MKIEKKYKIANKQEFKIAADKKLTGDGTIENGVKMSLTPTYDSSNLPMFLEANMCTTS